MVNVPPDNVMFALALEPTCTHPSDFICGSPVTSAPNVALVKSEAEINSLYRKLEPLTTVDEAVKAAHIQDIRRKYHSQDPEAAGIRETRQEDSSAPEEDKPDEENGQDRDESTAPTVSVITCPNCGKPLVIRTAKRGANAGKRFFGCSGYPACRYTSELPNE